MDELSKANKLVALNEKIKNQAYKSNLFKDRMIVTGEGCINAKIMLVGEAPGKDEERLGKPFVGAAGKNLNEFLSIMSIKREDVYITNTVKVRPFKLSEKTGKPVNRPPSAEELAFFTPYLIEEIKLIAPDIVATLGNFALRAIAGKNSTIGELHGKRMELEHTALFPLYHPASIIYNRALKDVYIDDLHRFAELFK